MLAAVTIAVAAAGVLLAVSLAWLGTNRDLDSNNMAMDMNTGMFELGVPSANLLKDPEVASEQWIPATESADGVITPSMLELFFPDGSGYGRQESDIITGREKTGVICVLEAEGEERSLRPGSVGTMSFIIYPEENDLLFGAEMSLSALGKRLVNGSVVYERLDDTIDPSDARAPALQHLKGHILFFAQRNDPAEPGGEYSYGGWIMPGSTFYITGAEGTNAAGYAVTLYWEWPVTNKRLRELLGTEETEGERINNYYYQDPSSGVTEINATGYNSADTEIGKHISHIAAELDVALSDAIPEGAVTVTAEAVNNG